MRRNRTFTFDLKVLKPHLPIVICFSVFVVGILLGCLLVGHLDYFKNLFSEKLTEFTRLREGRDIAEILIDSVKNIFPYYLLVFLVGTSVVGCALSPVILLYYGFSYGCLSGILYSSFALEGIMFNALICIPSILFCAFGLSILVRNAVSFSYLLSGICIKANKPVNIYSNFKEYCLHGLITLTAAATSLIFDVAMSMLFIGYFSI